MTGAPDPAEAARQLRAVVAAVDSGELAAGPDQRAWLRGAVDALDVVAGAGQGAAPATGPVSEP